MKTDRFPSASVRAAAVLLAGCLVAASLPGAGQTISFKIPLRRSSGSSSAKLAQALAQQVGEVQGRFSRNRRELQAMPGPGGRQVFARQEVDALIARTRQDLDQAIQQVGEPGLDALRAWSAEELRRIQGSLAAEAGQSASVSYGFSTPRAVALVASLVWLPPPGIATVGTTAPRQETIAAEESNRLLDQVGEVVSRIFVLASRNDLEVKLWVGSTPEKRATFRFWPRGGVKGDRRDPFIIRTNSERDHVLRGLYEYRAAWTKGQVTELLQYPGSSERLDLVNGSSFFCCRFDEQYCHHVASEKDCRP